MSKQPYSTHPKTVIELLLILLLVFAPLYWAPSLGGSGFDLPINLSVWAAALLIIAYGLWTTFRNTEIVLPEVYKWLLAMPIGILLSAIVAGVVNPTEWLFRISFIFLGVLFFFGLFQARIQNTGRLLVLILVSTLIQAAIGFFQYVELDLGFEILKSRSELPLGNFQQVNVLASFLSTGLLIAVFLLLRPLSKNSSVVKFLLLVSAGFLTFVLVATGSRVGMLSIAVSLPLMLVLYREQSLKRIPLLITLFVVMFLVGGLAKEGAERTLDKTYRITETQYADQRMSIYKISLDTIVKSPITGHGIGSFLAEWGKSSVDFHHNHPQAKLPSYLLHPHNELLMWAIEGGLVAVLGILIALIAVIYWVVRSGSQQNAARLVLLVPITMHSMVEHPFYLSALHWFVWLLLLYQLLASSFVIKSLNISVVLRQSCLALTLAFVVLGNVFIVHTALSQSQIYQLASRASEGVRVHHAIQNPYFSIVAEQMIQRIHIQNAIVVDDHFTLKSLANQIEFHIQQKPELMLFSDLLTVYDALELRHQYCQTVSTALGFYPANSALKTEAERCSWG